MCVCVLEHGASLSLFTPHSPPITGAVLDPVHIVDCAILQMYFSVSAHKFFSIPIKYKVIALALYNAPSYETN